MSHSSIIREGVVDDIPAIMRLKLEYRTGLPTRCGRPRRTGSATASARTGALPSSLPSRRPGSSASPFAATRYYSGWVGPTIALLDLCVEEPHRDRGVGTALLARVAEFAKARGCVMIELTMRAGNRAAALYERVGFAEVTDISNYVIAGEALDRLAAALPAPTRMAG
jgi:GNAT superfamily N-acetyltransferase